MVTISKPLLSQISVLLSQLSSSEGLIPPHLQHQITSIHESFRLAGTRGGPAPREAWVLLKEAIQEAEALLENEKDDTLFKLAGKIKVDLEDEMKALGPEDSLDLQSIEMIKINSNGQRSQSSPLIPNGFESYDEPPRPTSTPSPPPMNVPSELFPLIMSSIEASSNTSPTGLREGADSDLQKVALLSAIAIEPETVLPPGKSLFSLFSKPLSEEEEKDKKKRKRESTSSIEGNSGASTPSSSSGKVLSLDARVGGIMKEAFWNDCRDKLLGPTPAPAVRLSALQSDLSTALIGLLPTSLIFDLFKVPDKSYVWDRTAFSKVLMELISHLKRLCAPQRDHYISRLSKYLKTASVASHGAVNERELTMKALYVIQGILDLADLMKSDLKEYALLSIPPVALPALLRSLAQSHEQVTITSLFGPTSTLKPDWIKWVGGSESESAGGEWSNRLVFAVTSSDPVAWPHLPAQDPKNVTGRSKPPPPPPNVLHPVLIGSSKLLFKAQNLIQSLVITASLVAVIPQAILSPSLTTKIWNLLQADLIAGSNPTEESHTHLDDLELIILTGFTTAPPTDEEVDKIRSSIRRVLRTTDPVWGLLLKRLEDVIGRHLVSDSTGKGIPAKLRTGKEVVRGTGDDIESIEVTEQSGKRVIVKGFEGADMESGVGEVVNILEKVRTWVGDTWGDVVRR